MSADSLIPEVRHMLVESLMLKMSPDDLDDDVVLFSPEGLSLDSIDALELAVAIEKRFGVPTPSSEVARTAFVSPRSIAEFIHEHSSSASPKANA